MAKDELKELLVEALEESKDKVKTNRVFVDGKERLDLEDQSFFEFKGKKYDCYSEPLYDVVEKGLDPIKKYAEQLWLMDDNGDSLSDCGDIVHALVDNAQKIFVEWLNDFEKHVGCPGLDKISYANDYTMNGLNSGDTVSVSFRRREE